MFLAAAIGEGHCSGFIVRANLRTATKFTQFRCLHDATVYLLLCFLDTFVSLHMVMSDPEFVSIIAMVRSKMAGGGAPPTAFNGEGL